MEMPQSGLRGGHKCKDEAEGFLPWKELAVRKLTGGVQKRSGPSAIVCTEKGAGKKPGKRPEKACGKPCRQRYRRLQSVPGWRRTTSSGGGQLMRLRSG
ncbi:hypothetical protein [Herbaspirillum sp.]|uniref:hypothetical protein n=1 Tax=Herbaspirillum sp. TaxID=1890675 RepID=UPI00257BA3C9|nr:hypothetical protein [Herbaspirillum sp.]